MHNFFNLNLFINLIPANRLKHTRDKKMQMQTGKPATSGSLVFPTVISFFPECLPVHHQNPGPHCFCDCLADRET